MVTYEQWVEAVNEAYKAEGGTYVEGTAAELIQLAAEFWNRNSEQLKSIAYQEAVRLAQQNMNV